MDQHPFPGLCESKNPRIKNCDACRLSNRKCSRGTVCDRCAKKGVPCIYSRNSTRSRVFKELKRQSTMLSQQTLCSPTPCFPDMNPVLSNLGPVRTHGNEPFVPGPVATALHPFPNMCISQNARLKNCEGCRMSNRKCDRKEICGTCAKRRIPCVYSKNSTRNKAFKELKTLNAVSELLSNSPLVLGGVGNSLGSLYGPGSISSANFPFTPPGLAVDPLHPIQMTVPFDQALTYVPAPIVESTPALSMLSPSPSATSNLQDYETLFGSDASAASAWRFDMAFPTLSEAKIVMDLAD